MPTYYLSATPGTLVSIIEKGQLPDPLPAWMQENNIKIEMRCFRNFESSILASGKPSRISAERWSHQTFVLELEVPEEQSQSFLLETKLKPKTIQNYIKRIIVYSERAKSLLENLLKKTKCSKVIAIDINKNYYSKKYPHHLTLQTGVKRKHDDPVRTSSGAHRAFLLPAHKKRKVSGKFSLPEEYSLSCQRLFTLKQHSVLLREAFSAAKERIIITSYDLSPSTLTDLNFFELIKEVRNRKKVHRRNVSITIIYRKNLLIDKAFFEEYDVTLIKACIHSKVLIVDTNFLAVGSLDWLSADYTSSKGPYESILLRGKICASLIEQFWKTFEIHRTFFHYNYEKPHPQILRHPAKTPQRESSKESGISCIFTLQVHREYLRFILKSAAKERIKADKPRIIICLRSIPNKTKFKQTFQSKLLTEAVQYADIVFMCPSDDSNFQDIQSYLKQFPIHLLGVRNCHRNWILYDEHNKEAFTTGSLNWSLATRRYGQSYSVQNDKLEATLLIEGYLAKQFIEEFYASSLGKKVLQLLSKPHISDERMLDLDIATTTHTTVTTTGSTLFPPPPPAQMEVESLASLKNLNRSRLSL